MIIIKRGIFRTQIIGATPELKRRLRQSLSYTDEAQKIARFVMRKKKGYIPKWMPDPFHVLINDEGFFPSGLFDRALEIIKDYDDDVLVENDIKVPKAEPIELQTPLKLWSHQSDAMEAIKSERNGMIRIGTGGGKTKLSVKACAEVGQFPYLFVVNRISLLTQTFDDYQKYFGEKIGWIGDGTIDVQRINIATIGTLCSILKIDEKQDDEENLNYTAEQIDDLKKLLNNCKFVVVDECHHASTKTYTTMLEAMPNAVYKIGLSATPFRTDGADILLEAAFGKVIYVKTASELINENKLCQPEIYFVEYKDPLLTKAFPKTAKKGVHTKIYKACVVENELFNNIVAKLAIINAEMGRLTLISVRQIKHGKAIYDILEKLDSGLTFEFLHGQNKKDLDEEKIKADFGSGKIKILISTLFDEGVDIPGVISIVDAGGGRSPIKALQLIGRAIRKSPGKKKAYVFMFIQPYQQLHKHSQARAKILATEEAFKLQILDWENE